MTNTTIKIDEATVEDIDVLLKWRNAGDYNFCGNIVDDKITKDEYIVSLNSEMSKGQSELILVGRHVEFDKPIGSVWFDYLFAEKKDVIMSLYLDEAYRNSVHILPFLVKSCDIIFENYKKEMIRCEVSPFNHKMIRIAEKLEFKPLEDVNVDYGVLKAFEIDREVLMGVKKKYARILN